MSDDRQDYWSAYRAGITLFAVITLLFGWGVIIGYREDANWGHLAIELFARSQAADVISALATL